MRTRKGLDWTSDFSAIADAAGSLDDCIIDGEVVALDHNGTPDFAALQAALSEGGSKDLTYFAFDLLYVEGEDLRRLPLTERKTRLQQLFSRSNRAAELSNTWSIWLSLATPCCNPRVGSTSKASSQNAPTAPYRSGRTDTWLKAKCRGGQEVVIGGWSGSSRNLRSLLVGVYRGDHLVHTGRVGTGFNKNNSGGLLKKLVALSTDKSPFTGKGAPRRAKDVTWVSRS